MAKAKRLKSGNYRCLVYSHTEPTGKRKYESFTATTKKEAEYMAAEFVLEKERLKDCRKWTLGEAIDNYIELKRPVLSPTTIHGYEYNRRSAFQGIMDIPISKLNSTMLQEAINDEVKRKAQNKSCTMSPKSVKNAYGLVNATLSHFLPDRAFRVALPKNPRKIKRELPTPDAIFNAVKGTRMELPTLLAMWLSFTESEIRGLTKSKSLDGDYITIREVLVVVAREDVRKAMAKEETRNRRHKMPPYIKKLIDQVEGDIIVPMTPSMLLKGLKKCLREADLPIITFHDLRHINASVMAALNVPDVYAQERGGWKTDHVMKTVYTETFTKERQRIDNMIDDYFEKFIS